MDIGDRVKTPFGEYGLIVGIAESPNDWLVENAEDEDVYELYPEESLVLVPRTENTLDSDRTAKRELFSSAVKAVLDLMSDGETVTITKSEKKRNRDAGECNTLQG